MGNSFTNNTLYFLEDMCKCADIDTKNICIYKYIRGGNYPKLVYDAWNDNDKESYTITKVFGGFTQNLKEGTGKAYDGSKLRNTIKDCTWDIVILQQNSYYSDKDNLWDIQGVGGYFTNVIDTIKKYQPNTTIGICIPHASYNDNPNTYARFKDIAKSHKNYCEKHNIDLIIPYGTAVENIRLSMINTSMYAYSGDKQHISVGVGRYVASAAYYEAIFAPRSGKSILGNSFRYTVPESTLSNANYPTEYIDVTDDNAEVCQMAAILALKDMFEITNPDDFVCGINNHETKPSYSLKFIKGKGIVVDKDGIFYNSLGIKIK